MWVATRPPPGTWPLPSTIRSSPDDLDLDAVDAQHGGGGFQPVGFLDPQFLQAAHDGGALGEGGRHRQHQIFVDHRRRALRRHLDAAQLRGAHPELRHRLAGIAADLALLDRGAHFAQRREQAGAQRIGHDVGQNEVGALARSAPPRSGTPPRTDRPAPRPAAPCSSGWPVSAILRPWAPSRRRDDLRAEMLQHQLGMVAAGLGLDHGGDAGRGQPRQQHRGLDLGRGHRRAVEDRQRIARALQRQRQPAALGAGDDLAPINSSGSSDPPHRPRAQRGVAVEDRRDRAAGHRPHHQPAAGAGIAEIERRLRLREPADADARARARRTRRSAPPWRPAPASIWRY